METKNKKIINILAIIAISITIYVVVNLKGNQKDKGELIAKVNGQKVYSQDLQNFISNFLNSPVAFDFSQLGEEQQQAILQQYGVERTIYKQAKASGVKKDPEVKEKIKAVKEAILKEAYLNQISEKDITPEAIKANYEAKLPELQEALDGEKEYHASHILVDSLADANKVKEALKNKDFAEVAQEFSIDEGTKIRGGDLGFFSPEKMISEFSEQVAELQPGEISPPFKTNFGWHIVKLHEIRDSAVPTLEDMQEEIRKELYYKSLEKHISEISNNVTIEIIK